MQKITSIEFSNDKAEVTVYCNEYPLDVTIILCGELQEHHNVRIEDIDSLIKSLQEAQQFIKENKLSDAR